MCLRQNIANGVYSTVYFKAFFTASTSRVFKVLRTYSSIVSIRKYQFYYTDCMQLPNAVPTACAGLHPHWTVNVILFTALSRKCACDCLFDNWLNFCENVLYRILSKADNNIASMGKIPFMPLKEAEPWLYRPSRCPQTHYGHTRRQDVLFLTLFASVYCICNFIRTPWGWPRRVVETRYSKAYIKLKEKRCADRTCKLLTVSRSNQLCARTGCELEFEIWQ